MSLLNIKLYRNVYIKGYKRIPFQLMTGKNIIVYYGDIILGVESEPDKYDSKNDLYISCDCELKEIKCFTHIKRK